MGTNLATLSLKEIFNQSTADSLRDFPQLKTFYIGTTTETLYISPDAVAQLSASATPLQEQLNGEIAYMKEHHAAGMAFDLDGVSQLVPGILVEHEGRETRGQVSDRFPLTIETIAVLDHEIGHQVVPDGMDHPRQHVCECIADAYASLRHIQRFDGATDYFDYAPFTRARWIAHGYSTDHYTAPVIQKVDELRRKIDITRLSPLETAALARKIADDCALPEATLQRIADAFQPLSAYLAQNDITTRKDAYALTPATHAEYFRTLFDILRQNQGDKDVYKIGKSIVAHHADDIRAQAALGKDSFWQAGLNLMERPVTAAAKNAIKPR